MSALVRFRVRLGAVIATATMSGDQLPAKRAAKKD